MAWALAHSLTVMIAEANAIAPKRSKISDGTIASSAHHQQNPTSDHEVGARGLVHAVDLTFDPQYFDAHAYAERLRLSHDRRLRYVISRRRIAGPGTRAGGWEWHTYTGVNPHDHHAHTSILSTEAAESDGRPWWPETVPTPPERTIVVHQYVDSLVAPNGGTWHLQADGGIVTDTDGAGGPDAPFYGSVPGVGGLGATMAKRILAHGGGYRVLVQHTDESVSYFHFPAA